MGDEYLKTLRDPLLGFMWAHGIVLLWMKHSATSYLVEEPRRSNAPVYSSRGCRKVQRVVCAVQEPRDALALPLATQTGHQASQAKL